MRQTDFGGDGFRPSVRLHLKDKFFVTVRDEFGETHDVDVVGTPILIDVAWTQAGALRVAKGEYTWRPKPVGTLLGELPDGFSRGLSAMTASRVFDDNPGKVHECCSSTVAWAKLLRGVNRLYPDDAGDTLVAEVTITEAIPMETSNGSSFDLKLRVDRWVPRPAAFIELAAERDAEARALLAKGKGGGSLPRDLDDDIPF